MGFLIIWFISSQPDVSQTVEGTGECEGSDIDGVRGQAGEGKGAKMRQVAHFARAQSHNGNDGMSGRLEP